MTIPTATNIGFFRALWICILLLVAPSKFKQILDADNVLINQINPNATVKLPHELLRQVFISSFLLVLVSALVGYGAAYVPAIFSMCISVKAVSWLQVVGASLLLWGTLFVRGWEIQSYKGITLTERANHWIYRGLYCVGTAVIVFSLTFMPCQPMV